MLLLRFTYLETEIIENITPKRRLSPTEQLSSNFWPSAQKAFPKLNRMALKGGWMISVMAEKGKHPFSQVSRPEVVL